VLPKDFLWLSETFSVTLFQSVVNARAGHGKQREMIIISIPWLTGTRRNLSSSFYSRTSPEENNPNKEPHQTAKNKIKQKRTNIGSLRGRQTRRKCSYQVMTALKTEQAAVCADKDAFW